MARVNTYRRMYDAIMVEGFQYGEGQPWDQMATIRVAAFVTGIDINAQTTIRTERLQDVVRPILNDWDMSKGQAPIEVAQGSGKTRLDLGDWIVREPNGTLLFVKEKAFYEQYEPLHKVDGQFRSLVEIETDKLGTYIYEECMTHLEGDLYRSLAENIAGKLIKAGWKKED